jgi:hypothetical protein
MEERWKEILINLSSLLIYSSLVLFTAPAAPASLILHNSISNHSSSSEEPQK